MQDKLSPHPPVTPAPTVNSPVRSQAQPSPPSLVAMDFYKSSVFDKITSGCSSGSDESLFYSAVKNIYVCKIIRKVAGDLYKNTSRLEGSKAFQVFWYHSTP